MLLLVLAALPSDTFDLDRFLAPKEAVLHLTAALAGLCALRSPRPVATRVDAALLAFLGVSVVSAGLAVNGWAAARALAITASGLLLFWTAGRLREAGLGPHLLATLVVGIVLAAATALGQAYGLEFALFSDNRVPGGTLGNRNFVGHLAAIGLPLAVLLVGQVPRRWLLVAVAGVAVLAAVLVLSRSRAAWLASAAVLAVLLIGTLFAPALRSHGRTWARGLVLAVVLAGGAVAAVSLPNALRWTSDTPYLETARGVANYQDGSGAGRLVQYRTSLRLVRERPLVGVGPGNWTVAYPGVADRGDPSLDPRAAGVTMNPWPSSDWVALVAERGVLGLLALGLGALGLAVHAVRRFRRAEEVGAAQEAVVLLALLTGTAVAGLFDAVTLLAWPTFFVWAAAGLLYARPTPDPLAPPPAWPTRLRSGVFLLLVLGASVSAVQALGRTAALVLYDGGPAALAWAARLDPGHYRVRLAAARADAETRCRHATAAAALRPHAAEAARLARGCE